jgi:hypothetical protein
MTRHQEESRVTAVSVHSKSEIMQHDMPHYRCTPVREALSNAYPDKEIPSKTAVYRLVTNYRNTGSV